MICYYMLLTGVDKINELEKHTNRRFEDIKHIDEVGNVYWLARELQNVLEYTQWRRFEETLGRSKISCTNSGTDINDHFANVGKMVNLTKKRLRL